MNGKEEEDGEQAAMHKERQADRQAGRLAEKKQSATVYSTVARKEEVGARVRVHWVLLLSLYSSSGYCCCCCAGGNRSIISSLMSPASSFSELLLGGTNGRRRAATRMIARVWASVAPCGSA